MTLQQMLETRAQAATKIKELADRNNNEDHEWSAEDEEQWASVNSEYDSLSQKIERAQRAESIEKAQEEKSEIDRRVGRKALDSDGGKSKGTDGAEEIRDEHRIAALQSWFRYHQGEDLTDFQEESCRLLKFKPYRLNLDVRSNVNYDEIRRSFFANKNDPSIEFRAQSVGTATAGGHTVPEGFVNAIERSLLAFGGMRQVSTVFRTPTGNDLPWPTVDDTSNAGAILTENSAVSEQDVTFGQIVFNAYKYSSKLVRVSIELLEDEAIQPSLPDLLGSLLGERIARIENTHFTTGTGSSQPNGIITAASVGKTAASATAIASDELFDLIHSVDPAYRSQAGAGFMMHDNVLLVVRKLQDGQNQYLWQPGLTMGQPDQLLGYPVTINQDMASSVATTNKTILFGALRKYQIRDVAGFRVRRLVERYADNDQEGFMAFHRADGDMLDAGTDPCKVLQQA